MPKPRTTSPTTVLVPRPMLKKLIALAEKEQRSLSRQIVVMLGQALENGHAPSAR